MPNSKNSKLIIEWPDLDLRVTADFLDDLNPEFCDVIRQNMPIETIQSHGVIAGGLLMAPTRIVCTRAPRTLENLAEQPLGRINFSLFYLAISMKYSPIAEPLDISPVAQVCPEDIDTLARLGKRVWQHTCDLKPDKGYIRCLYQLRNDNQ